MIEAPVTLFHAGDAPWSTPFEATAADQALNYVTDGPFVYREKNGALGMIWSSFHEGRYSIGVAESKTGTILGPWTHRHDPILQTGGHGMLFEDFAGKRLLAIYAPNTIGAERLQLMEF